jgi:hypothetical protein
MTDSSLILARHRLGIPSLTWFLRLVLVILAVLVFWLAVQLAGGGVLFVFWRRTLLVFAVAGLGLVMLVAAWLVGREKAASLIESSIRLVRQSSDRHILAIPVFLLILALVFYLFLGPFAGTFESLPSRFLLLISASLIGSFVLDLHNSTSRWWHLFLFTCLLFAFLYQLAGALPSLSLTPFSRGWSEGTRYYHASLLLSERYYGLSLPPFYQDLSRYVVEAAPLLLPRPSLWLERSWEFLLTFLLPALTVFLVLRRLAANREDKLFWWGLLLWGTLTLLQGPVYFYLLPAAILVLAFYHRERLLQSLAAIVAASFWAGISRVNWMPIPAMLAIALYLLEKPVEKKSIPAYLAPPIIYTITGLGTAYLARQWYADISQISEAMFNAAFWQQLLWYRLFPGSLNQWGILPSGLVMTAPLIILMVIHLRRRGAGWHPIRLIGLGSMLLVLLAGGFVVSAKIGGGSNLHNLDGYLVLSMTVGLHLLFDRFTPEEEPASTPVAFSPLLISMTALMVMVFTVSQAYPGLPSMDRHTDSLASLQELVDETVSNGGSVLFISQRQLLTFGLIQGVSLVPEYDNIDLMEFAMSNYRPSIDRFQADIAAHKYALIIAPTPPGQLQDRQTAFAEENNAWLKRVSIPMLRSYEILAEFPEGDFVVLVPEN